MTTRASVAPPTFLGRIAMRLGLPWERDQHGYRRRGAWSQSYTGAQYWPIDPHPNDIHYDDLCIGLARAYRYRGMTRDEYSVAEHSVIVSVAAEKLARERGLDPRAAARWGLMHDGSEAWIGDVARPLKRQRTMRGYRKVEEKWEAAIIERFDLVVTDDIRAVVDEVDDRIILDEIEALFLDPDMWARAGRYLKLKPLNIEIAALPWRLAVHLFTQRYLELWPEEARRIKHHVG